VLAHPLPKGLQVLQRRFAHGDGEKTDARDLRRLLRFDGERRSEEQKGRRRWRPGYPCDS